MNVVTTVTELRQVRGRAAAARVALVPTMGALHEGHASLFRQARADADLLVASVFVNPRQFDDPADLAAYPREMARDIAIADRAGVDVLFAPTAEELYPARHAVRVQVAGPALGFEADHRPGHFDGVVTVCLMLFHCVRPGVAWFGQKDAQQVAVVSRLVADLHLAIEIRVGATVRAPGGLALSSRNARLSPDERRQAAALPRALRAGLEAHRRQKDAVAAARAELEHLEIDYVDLADFNGQPTLVVAVRIGAVRLIDNVNLDTPSLSGFSHEDAHD